MTDHGGSKLVASEKLERNMYKRCCMTIPLIHAPIMSNFACAVNANGTLKSAADIEWFNDVDDDAPMAQFLLNLLSQPLLYLCLKATSTAFCIWLILARHRPRLLQALVGLVVQSSPLQRSEMRHSLWFQQSAPQRHLWLHLLQAHIGCCGWLFWRYVRRAWGTWCQWRDARLGGKSDSEDEDAREEYERNQAMADTDCDVSSPLFYFWRF